MCCRVWLGRLRHPDQQAGVEVTALVTEIEVGALRNMLDVNIFGTALGLQHAFRAMRPGALAGQGEVVVNVASVAATIAFPANAAYSATKSAVDRLARVAAMEWGKLVCGVRVNCAYPGPGADHHGRAAGRRRVVGAIVEQTPPGRQGTGEEMAATLVFLCSGASRFITGAGLPVDGGMGM